MVRAGNLNKILEIHRIVLSNVKDPNVPNEMNLLNNLNLPSDGNRLSNHNSYGEQKFNWVKIKTTRGGIKPVTGNETFLDDALKNKVTHIVSMRYIPGLDLTPKDVIVFRDRSFDIEYILNWSERNSNVTIACTERLYDE